MPNMKLFTRPLMISRRNRASMEALMYPVNVNPALATPKTEPPQMPMALAQMVRHGSMTIMAINLGATRKRIGLMAMVSSASSSSVTFMVPISAAKEEPERPMTTMAVMSGPSSRLMEMATALATKLMAPNFLSS